MVLRGPQGRRREAHCAVHAPPSGRGRRRRSAAPSGAGVPAGPAVVPGVLHQLGAAVGGPVAGVLPVPRRAVVDAVCDGAVRPRDAAGVAASVLNVHDGAVDGPADPAPGAGAPDDAVVAGRAVCAVPVVGLHVQLLLPGHVCAVLPGEPPGRRQAERVQGVGRVLGPAAAAHLQAGSGGDRGVPSLVRIQRRRDRDHRPLRGDLPGGLLLLLHSAQAPQDSSGARYAISSVHFTSLPSS